ncbi:MAG: hypothetical protein AB4042_02590 [Leptolyngbyaceae cyanobacterium]
MPARYPLGDRTIDPDSEAVDAEGATTGGLPLRGISPTPTGSLVGAVPPCPPCIPELWR